MLGKIFRKKNKKHNNESSQDMEQVVVDANQNKNHNNNNNDDDAKDGQTRSQDDLDFSQADLAKKQAKMQKLQKRHSHIGALRSHQKKLNLPNKGNGDANNNGNSNSNNQNGLPAISSTSTTSTAALMSSGQTNARLQQLMNMRSGKDSKNRAKSMNYRKAKQQNQENKYPKKRRNEVHTDKSEPRRHSMVPNREDKEHEKHMKDRRATTHKKTQRKVQYRVKNEVYVLYDYYQPVRIIGTGAYAVVCEALNTQTGKKCAIKKNKGVFDHITDARRILREIKLMMHFDHQDIIPLIDVIPCEAHEIDSYNDCYLVMPKMETNLAKVIRSKQKLTDRHYQFFIYQMLRGLRYMHSASVIHRDLKPENILINGADCNVKITDFGLARGVCKDDAIEQPTEYVVTRWYRSPEVMCSAGFYDEKVDIWSLGCIFAELILRRPLFPGQNYLDQLKIIFEVMGTPKDFTWIKTPEAKRWVQKLQPHDGKPYEEVFENASVPALTLLKKMLLMDPAKRADAEECMRDVFFKDLYREEDEEECPPFDLSFEFEKSIKTKFGVRHMMYDALISFDKHNKIKQVRAANKLKMKKQKEKNSGNSNSNNNSAAGSATATAGGGKSSRNKNSNSTAASATSNGHK